MSNFDSESHFDGDWEDKGGLTWNEYDWRQYLAENDKEIVRFLSIYNSLKDQADHLDEAAHLMGWEVEDWSNPVDSEALEDSEDFSEPIGRPEDGDFDDMEPYTLHKHPVFIVSQALHNYLRQSWEQFMLHAQPYLSPQLSWSYSNSLHRSELYSTLALQSLDLGDFALTVCHLKTAISALNQSLSTLQNLSHRNARFLEMFQQEMYIRIFDLREVWLRVMQDCREEVNRRNEGRR